MSTSINPVAADQHVSMRRSASASISSTALETNLKPRHRSRARRHNNHSSAARGLRGTPMPMPASMARIRSRPRSMSPPMRNCSAAAPLELDPLRVTGSGRRAEVGVGGLGRPAGIGERAGQSFSPRVGGG